MTAPVVLAALLAVIGLAAAAVTGVRLVVSERRRTTAVGRVNAALGVSAATLADCAAAVEEFADRTARLAERYRAAVGSDRDRPAGCPAAGRAAALLAALAVALDETRRLAAICDGGPDDDGLLAALGIGEALDRAAAAGAADGGVFRDLLVAGAFDGLLVLPEILGAYAPSGRAWTRLAAAAGLASGLVRLRAALDDVEVEVVAPLTVLAAGDPRAVAEDPRGLHRVARIDARVAKTVLTVPGNRMLVVDCLRPGLCTDGGVLRPARLAVHNHAVWNG